MSKVVRNLRFNGGGSLTFVEGRARRHVTSGEVFSVDSNDLADALLADPAVVDLDAPVESPEVDVPEGTGYEAMRVPQLKELAEKRGLELPSKAKKADLVAAHLAADEGDTASDVVAVGPEPTSDNVDVAASGGPITLGDLPDSAKAKD